MTTTSHKHAQRHSPLVPVLSAAGEISCREFEVGSPDHRAALDLRDRVLRRPLGLTLTAEDVAEDGHCLHLGCFESDRLIAVLLLQPRGDQTLQMRQVAVEPAYQKRGIGSRIVGFAEVVCKRQGCTTLFAHARVTALGFYLNAGYVPSEPDFIEQTIPHKLVTKHLDAGSLDESADATQK